MEENTPAFLDAGERLQWNNPAEIVAAVHIPAGSRVAEIGCGTGWFTFAIEAAIRPRGMVYALDKLPTMLQILETKRRNYERVLTLPCGENEFELDSGEVDVVFHANVLHETLEPEKHLREAHRVLKSGGRMIVIEWKAIEAGQPGPPESVRMGASTTRELLEATGFDVIGLGDVGPYHYVVQAIKK